MADKKVKDLDNFENTTENIIANMANMGFFSQGFSSITPFTQINPFAIIPESKDDKEVDGDDE